MESSAGKFPVDTKADVSEIDNQATELVISKFSDKLLVVITQLGKVGNLIEIRRDVARKDDPSSSVYNIRVLLGKDDDDIHVAARFLMNYIPTDKTVILALCLKSYGVQTLRQIGQRLQSHPSFTAAAAQ